MFSICFTRVKKRNNVDMLTDTKFSAYIVGSGNVKSGRLSTFRFKRDRKCGFVFSSDESHAFRRWHTIVNFDGDGNYHKPNGPAWLYHAPLLFSSMWYWHDKIF